MSFRSLDKVYPSVGGPFTYDDYLTTYFTVCFSCSSGGVSRPYQLPNGDLADFVDVKVAPYQLESVIGSGLGMIFSHVFDRDSDKLKKFLEGWLVSLEFQISDRPEDQSNIDGDPTDQSVLTLGISQDDFRVLTLGNL